MLLEALYVHLHRMLGYAQLTWYIIDKANNSIQAREYRLYFALDGGDRIFSLHSGDRINLCAVYS